jgi:hypothetical protein
VRARSVALSAILATACGGSSGPPSSLPFTVTRVTTSAPVDPAEVSAFTAKLTGFLKTVDYFNWAARISHGVDASTGKPDFAIWWQDVDAVKTATGVTFRHATDGRGHNVYIPTSKALLSAIGGYLLSGDPAMGRIVERYSKGIAAACLGLVHDASDPNPFLMARNVVAQNHSYMIDGRPAAVDFSPWYSAYSVWNAQRFEYPNNPSWGDVWVTNMRSKDDVPHYLLATTALSWVIANGKDASVRDAAKEADRCVRGFTKDIVDSGYLIRTKDAEGKPFVPSQDLASFVMYESVAPNAECSAKLSSAMLGYKDARGLDCGLNDTNGYESIATAVHYYNYAIIDTFHLSAIWSSLLAGKNDAARQLVVGLAVRAGRYLDPNSGEPGLTNPRWPADMAAFLFRAAMSGLPLSGDEVRLIHAEYGKAIDAYAQFPRWDLWSSSVPNGTYVINDGYLPSDQGMLVEIEEMGFALAYCWSPFRAPNGQPIVDCDAIKSYARAD